MRYVGWHIPKECNKLEVGSIVAMFCPDLRYLMNTQQVIDESFESSENFMETNPEQFVNLSNPPVYSLSKESEHTSDLILVMVEKSESYSDIYRLSAAAENSAEKFVMTKLFRLRILQKIKSIEVYDDFAFVIFDDESVLLAFRPEIEGRLAKFNTKVTTDESLSGYLSFRTQTIVYYNIVPDSSQQYSYILNLLTEDNEPNETTGQPQQYLS